MTGILAPLHGQPDASKGGRDELIFVDGEKLIGQLERSTGDSVTFKSDMAGEITAEWSKIKELHSPQNFAVVEKGMRLGWRENTSKIPHGPISITGQGVSVNTGAQPAPIIIPFGNLASVIDFPTFETAVAHRPGVFEDWKGAATVGISLVAATQSSRSYTSSVSLVRSIPTETWMDPSSRTTLSFTSSYGRVSEPGTPEVKTSIFHADGQRDQYFTRKAYVFGEATFDHDVSQGLDLQQTFGGGLGWTAIKESNEEFDLKGELTYVNQQFFNPAENQKLLGSIFSETYNHKFERGILFREELAILPALTSTKAYSAAGRISLTIPLIKHISITSGSQDTFLNDPSPGFRKNSFQFTTGITYTLPK